MSANSLAVAELGLMGGMFDPVHNGHLAIATDSLQLLQLDTLFLLPCGQPVHGKQLAATSAQRKQMLQLAIQGNDALQVDDRECQRDKPSYAFDTLTAIRQEFPETRLYYIMGQDAFNHFDTWYHWRDIFSLAHIVVAGRPGYRPELSDEVQAEMSGRQVDSVGEIKRVASGKVLVAELALLEISSSRIKDNISQGKSIDDLVPGLVAEYIKTNGLYSLEKSY